MEGCKSHSPQPLFPSKLRQHSDDDPYTLPPFMPSHSPIHRRGTNKSVFYLLAFFVTLCVALLVFSLVVLRPNSPTLHLEVVTVKKLSYDTLSWESPFLNVSLLAGLTLRNRNFGRYEFEGNRSVIGFAYKGIVLGEKKIQGGTVGARETTRIRVEMVVGYSGMEASGNLSQGIAERVLKLRSYSRIAGEIRLVKYLKRSLSSEMNCTMNLNLATQKFQDLICE